MKPSSLEINHSALAGLSQDYDLDLVILFGSRATGNIHVESDTDIAVLGRHGPMPADRMIDLPFRLSEVIKPGEIDLVDLERASGLLRHVACEQGLLLFEASPGLFAQFRLRAWNMYQDERIQIRRHDSAAIRAALRSLAHESG